MQLASANYLQIVPFILQFLGFTSYFITSEVSLLHHLLTLSAHCSNTWVMPGNFGKQSLMLFHQILNTNEVAT